MHDNDSRRPLLDEATACASRLSSWANVADHRDDKLIWYKYAGGADRVNEA
jgi:hypothetical protein